MFKKTFAGLTALVVAGSFVLATVSPADAQRWHRHRGGGGAAAAIIGGLAAGAIIGGAIAQQRRYYEPYPAYRYSEPVYEDDIAYCMQRFRSYDPASGTYLGYDGLRHPCP